MSAQRVDSAVSETSAAALENAEACTARPFGRASPVPDAGSGQALQPDDGATRDSSIDSAQYNQRVAGSRPDTGAYQSSASTNAGTGPHPRAARATSSKKLRTVDGETLVVVQGSRLYALDPRHDAWFQVVIKKICQTQVRVHWVGWNDKYDTWIHVDSGQFKKMVYDDSGEKDIVHLKKKTVEDLDSKNAREHSNNAETTASAIESTGAKDSVDAPPSSTVTGADTCLACITGQHIKHTCSKAKSSKARRSKLKRRSKVKRKRNDESNVNTVNAGYKDIHNTACFVCNLPGHLLCCSSCPQTVHMRCLDPPLLKVPVGDWFCPYCVKEGVARTPKKSRPKDAQMDKSGARNGTDILTPPKQACISKNPTAPAAKGKGKSTQPNRHLGSQVPNSTLGFQSSNFTKECTVFQTVIAGQREVIARQQRLIDALQKQVDSMLDAAGISSVSRDTCNVEDVMFEEASLPFT